MFAILLPCLTKLCMSEGCSPKLQDAYLLLNVSNGKKSVKLHISDGKNLWNIKSRQNLPASQERNVILA